MAENVIVSPLALKLVQLMEKVGYIQKDGWNDKQKYKFASAGAVLDKTREQMIPLGLASIPTFELISDRDIATSSGGRMQLVTVLCTLTVIDAISGDAQEAKALGSGTDNLDKAIAKAQTMALKYAWMSLLNISTGDDPERENSPNLVAASVSPALTHLFDVWGRAWNPQELGGYIMERFKKPMEQLTDQELENLAIELENYQKGERK